MSPISLPIIARATRRADRDPALLDVGFVLADDRVTLLLAAFGVFDGHGGPEFDSRTRQFGWIDNFGECGFCFELADLGLDQALLFFGGAVIGVLGQIAVPARDLDRAAVRDAGRRSSACTAAPSSSRNPRGVMGNFSLMGTGRFVPPSRAGRKRSSRRCSQPRTWCRSNPACSRRSCRWGTSCCRSCRCT